MSLNDRIKDAVRPEILSRLRNMLPDVAPGLHRVGQYWPHEYQSSSFTRPVFERGGLGAAASGELPVPPPHMWAYYCTSADSWLQSGREDVATMRGILTADGAPVESAGRVLDLGCATGRMIRWMTDLTDNGAQVWGADVWSTAILWCQDHLSPPCWFVNTTMAPHLPFEDRSLDLVYCGSVFTHIDELAEAWFLELHRVLAPGGRLFFSVNDRHAVEIFEGRGRPEDYPRFHERTGGREEWERFVAEVQADAQYRRFVAGDAYMVTLARDTLIPHVMWDSEVLAQRLAYGYRLKAVTPASYGHQTTVLLERLGRS
jgi:SAM-dependent methyltransferase